ncbi:aminotransferase [Philodulcilactobacillus myokoensis]|uniref:Aminotransferase n=1 Tax=Philodulcilactobacillus myokoensis TaxID=2929573 RepID=A0A9W6ES83_9LACO|nr:aminotransferase class I/II-fold pyridoxal phosphate-dependent enzyme [Philodulcilactobacillus myokoensis]GLB46535.1 aminotransferase [Philodulcilactobacillus myokoensis]
MPELIPQLSKQYNHKLDLVQPSGIRAFDQRISKVPGIVKLTIGEPDLNTPDHVKEAAINGIKNNDTHYSAQPGKLELRKAIANYLHKSQGLNYDPNDEIIVTIGATEAIYATFEAMINPGDKVLIATPAFALYQPIVTLLGGIPVDIDTSGSHFNLSADRLEKVIEKEGDAVKAVLINYPGNPTGAEYSKDSLEAIAKVIKKHHLFAITDEIYAELVYGVKHYSLARWIPDQTIVINGLSKSHAMTGWRVGYVAGPAEFVKKATKVHAFMVTSPSDPAQDAATEALTNGLDDPIGMRKIYFKRRNFINKAMNDMGLKTVLPQGAFYLFVKIPASYNNSEAFALDLARKAKVGVTPGSAFGTGGEGYIRLSYAASDHDLHLAADRMKTFMDQINK